MVRPGLASLGGRLVLLEICGKKDYFSFSDQFCVTAWRNRMTPICRYHHINVFSRVAGRVVYMEGWCFLQSAAGTHSYSVCSMYRAKGWRNQ